MKLTKYEKARLIGSRALQIAMGAPVMIKLSDKDLAEVRYNPVTIALKEFAEDAIPIKVKKPKA